MAQSKAPSPRALASYEAARAAGASVEEASALLAPKPRVKRERETGEYMAMCRRALKAAGLRAADGDEPELMELLGLFSDWENAVANAIRGQRQRGMSWAYVAQATGTSRQSAHERWAPKIKALGGTGHG